MQEQTNTRIGDYEILGTLGNGGMGRVYRVRNVISDRIEAMKILLPDLSGRQDLVNRFLREIKLVASLNHPNIASLCTAMTVDNQLIMVMEFVDGRTLSQMLESGPLPVGDSIRYLTQALAALGYAHGRGIVHRDVKPANMMLTVDGTIKLMDFGIARVEAERSLTQTGTTLGSLDYMSPEQILGQAVDGRSDLYSIGVSLYEMVTGQRPFRADSDYELMAAHVKQAPRNPIEIKPWLPAQLNALILRSIAKTPGERFQSAEEMIDALRTEAGDAAPAAGMVRAATIVETPGSAVRAATLVEGFSTVPELSGHRPTEVLDASRSQRGMTQVAGIPHQSAIVVRSRSPLAKHAAVAAGLVITVGGLVAGTTLVMRNHDKGGDNKPPVQQAAATTAVTPPPKPPAVVAKARHAPPGSPHPALHASLRANAQVPTQPAPQAAPPPSAAQPAISPATKQRLDDLEVRLDQLDARASAVNNSLNNMQRSMRSQGLGMRGDMVARQTSMNTSLSKAHQALGEKDPDRGERFAAQAESDVKQLEEFLGR